MSPSAELAELESELAPLLAEERAVPRPEWRQALDGRVAAGFPRPARRKRARPRGLRLWGPALGFAACALVAVVIVGSALSGRSTPQGESFAVPAQSSSSSSSSGSVHAAPRSDANRVPAASASTDLAARRRVVRDSQLYLGVAPRKMQEVAQRVVAVTGTFDGVVLSSTVSSGDSPSANFSLRFPSERVDQAVIRLAALGHVRSQTSTSQDVTRGYIDAHERVDALVAERAALVRALAKATTTTDINSLKGRIAATDRHLVAGRHDFASIRARTSNSVVSVQLSPETRSGTSSPGGGGWSPRDALHAAGRILSVSAGVALVILACLVPLVVLGLLARLATTALRRRRREAALA